MPTKIQLMAVRAQHPNKSLFDDTSYLISYTQLISIERTQQLVTTLITEMANESQN